MKLLFRTKQYLVLMVPVLFLESTRMLTRVALCDITDIDQSLCYIVEISSIAHFDKSTCLRFPFDSTNPIYFWLCCGHS